MTSAPSSSRAESTQLHHSGYTPFPVQFPIAPALFLIAIPHSTVLLDVPWGMRKCAGS